MKKIDNIHHFVHLGYCTQEYRGYQNSVLSRIEEIGEKIRNGVNDIIVLVGDGESFEENMRYKSINKIFGIISVALMYRCLSLKPIKLKKRINDVLYGSGPKEVIDFIISILSKYDDFILKSKLFPKSLKGKTDEEVLEIWYNEIKNIKRAEKNGISMLCSSLYDEIYSKVSETFLKGNHLDVFLELERNMEFKNRIDNIIKESIPSDNLFRVDMRSYDTSFEILGRNVVIPKEEDIFGEYHILSKMLFYGQLRRKDFNRLKNDFNRLSQEIKEKGFRTSASTKHHIGGEYSDCCVSNYSDFLSHFLNVKDKHRKICPEISLEKPSLTQ